MPAPRTAPFSDATWATALGHRGLVRTIARRYAGRGFDVDDLVHEGLIGACRAVELYRPRLGTFSAYAGMWIKHRLRTAIVAGQLVRKPCRTRLADAGTDYEPIGEGEDEPADARTPPDPGDALDLADALPRLSARRREIVARCYGLDGETPESEPEIAGRLGITKQAVQVTKMRAIAELRGRLHAG